MSHRYALVLSRNIDRISKEFPKHLKKVVNYFKVEIHKDELISIAEEMIKRLDTSLDKETFKSLGSIETFSENRWLSISKALIFIEKNMAFIKEYVKRRGTNDLKDRMTSLFWC